MLPDEADMAAVLPPNDATPTIVGPAGVSFWGNNIRTLTAIGAAAIGLRPIIELPSGKPFESYTSISSFIFGGWSAVATTGVPGKRGVGFGETAVVAADAAVFAAALTAFGMGE